MVDYSKYMKPLRASYIPLKLIYVELPPIKSDCTCLGVDNSLSIMNSPADYCYACNNIGYIETKVRHSIYGALVDFAADTNSFVDGFFISQAGTYNNQRYVIHASLEDCTTTQYPGQNCFDLSKEVEIDGTPYLILSIDKSTMLGQIRVTISRTN